ncbi:hypothetical protein BKA64DRAFT_759096 [Cadophora sp. MPI-SDFR-AT-0126]|nr:hypothetical protein BKA64DRAFT_759096 [Leotiomycetes sp. MPI-SDFR-AT-0126]
MIYSLVLAVSLGLAFQASGACERALLQEATTAYISAQTSGKSSLLPLAPNTTYFENDISLSLTSSSSVLSQPLKIDISRSLHDTSSCTTFTELTAATNPHPYVIHTRMLLSSPGSTITSIQSVVTDAGDWVFNATGHLYYNSLEDWSPIPSTAQDSRAVIQAAADAYLDSWGNGSVLVPYGTPCARLEGGAYTDSKNLKTANTCKMPQFPLPFAITNRRYVVDEVMGAVDVFNDFPFIDKTRPDGTPSSNLVRVEGGKIRYVHELTVCATRGCGR